MYRDTIGMLTEVWFQSYRYAFPEHQPARSRSDTGDAGVSIQCLRKASGPEYGRDEDLG
jgi:hypothetical protein